MVADSGPPQAYHLTRTARAEKWDQEVKFLRGQIEQLNDYEIAVLQFRSIIEEAFKSVPGNDSREIARADLMEVCSKRQTAVQRAIASKLRALQALEAKGAD